MARRRSTFDLLMQVASYLPWPACLALAAGSAVVLHLLAVHLSTPMGSAETVSAVQSPGVLGAFYARTLYGTFATFLQFLIPAALLFAALASLVRRSQAQALLAQAQSAPAAAISSMTWSQFERLIGESFRRRGYEVTETGGSGSDGGVDLLHHFLRIAGLHGRNGLIELVERDDAKTVLVVCGYLQFMLR